MPWINQITRKVTLVEWLTSIIYSLPAATAGPPPSLLPFRVYDFPKFPRWYAFDEPAACADVGPRWSLHRLGAFWHGEFFGNKISPDRMWSNRGIMAREVASRVFVLGIELWSNILTPTFPSWLCKPMGQLVNFRFVAPRTQLGFKPPFLARGSLTATKLAMRLGYDKR